MEKMTLMADRFNPLMSIIMANLKPNNPEDVLANLPKKSDDVENDSHIEILTNLGFTHNLRISNWNWEKYFFVNVGEPKPTIGSRKITIQKTNDLIATGDRREVILYNGQYVFHNKKFADKLLLFVGIEEKITGIKIVETNEEIGHRWFLEKYGFTEMEENWWTCGIYSVTIVPPVEDIIRGKCIILRRNFKKPKKKSIKAEVCYKGRYFFNHKTFTKTLFKYIGFFQFVYSKKKKDYQFEKELWHNNKFLDVELLKF